MSESFHTLYRPETFDEFIGSEEIKKAVLSSINTTQTYLFHGDRGCGKTTLARLVGKELAIDDLCIFEIDGADKTGVNDMRNLKAEVPLKPLKGNKKMYIIDEVHRVTGNAQDNILKVTEEPPAHVVFALCTTEPNKVVSTLSSRCAKYRVRRLKKKEMSELLDWVISDQNLNISNKVITSIMDAAAGIPREALILLDQVKGLDAKDALSLIEYGSLDDIAGLRELCQLLLRGSKNKGGKWNEARKILSGMSGDHEEIRRKVLEYMAKVILDTESSHPVAIAEEFIEPFYSSGRAGLFVAVYRSCLL